MLYTLKPYSRKHPPPFSIFQCIKLCLNLLIHNSMHSIWKQMQVFFLNCYCCNIILFTLLRKIDKPTVLNIAFIANPPLHTFMNTLTGILVLSVLIVISGIK